MAFVLSLVLIISMRGVQETNARSEDIFKDNTSKSYVVTDYNGNVLIENNSSEKREVASICKLMTTLITLENIESGAISLEDKFIASEKACSVEGSQAFLDLGSEYEVEELLKSVIVASANDSAVVLAEGIAGNENNFVNMMNAKCKIIGMDNTKYANSTGLPGGEQYSTAVDTAKLLKEVSKYDIYKKDCKIWMDKLIHPSGRETELVNTNRLIKYYPNCITGKTGFTDEAGYCLSSTASKNNLNLICVVLGCDSSADRFTESVELYNYTYANFISEKILDKEVMLDKKINIVGGKEKELSLRSENDYYLTRNILDKINYSFEYEIEEKIKAPIKKGEIVGKVLVRNNEDIIASVNVVASDDIEKETYMDIVRGVIGEFGFTTN
jgi:D-alanyl-D-alanine carboxypeptidase (penicillin-binding protein 5/6)